MNKLKLSLEALDVESFATVASTQDAGTVHAYITLGCPQTPQWTCDHTCQCSDGCNTWDTACGSDNTSVCTYKDYTCGCPTVVGLTCEYDTCGACNPTDPNCTTYCP